MSVEHSPEHGIAYHFVAYDADGRERRGQHGPASADLLEAAKREHPTDVFFFSHGWNADPKGATGQYGRWLDAMAARTSEPSVSGRSQSPQQKLSRIAMRDGSAPTATQLRTASSIALAAMWYVSKSP